MWTAIVGIAAAIIAAIIRLAFRQKHDYAAGRDSERVRGLEAEIEKRERADELVDKARAARERAANDGARLHDDDGFKRKKPGS